jgi:hypothetical protein
MWIVFGTADKTKRVVGGAKIERHCDHCGERTTFYEKEILSTFRLYFIDVFDYRRQRVMACGGCGTCYATDELGGADGREGTGLDRVGDGVEQAARKAGRFLGRASEAVESRLSSLLSDRSSPEPAPPADAHEEGGRSEAVRGATDEQAALDEALDPLEARFQELERKVRVRID